MKLNRLFSAVLSAALLTGLCACVPHDPAEAGPSAGVGVSARPLPTPEPSEIPENPPEDSASPEPTLPPVSEYDREHRLDTAVPGLTDGLEMPVAGATGYTTVSLPLWSFIPSKPAQPEPSPPQPAPPGKPPDVTESPEPPPDETGEPGPDETGEPASGGAGEPGPDDPAGTVPPQEPENPEPTPEQPPEIPPEPEQQEPLDPARTMAASAPQSSARALGSYEGAVTVWEPGVAFVILEENGDWWRVSRGNETGWIEHRSCMINLPDVVPSIIYDDANAYSSRYVSSGREIPGVTGEILCHSLVYNVRLGRQEYVMPILYSAARNVCAAQHRALAEGNCLVVCQAFQSYDAQAAVTGALTQLANVDPEVKAGLTTPPWSMNWFTSAGASGHQRGYALDVSMVKVYGTETRYVGSYPYLYMTNYAQYEMPTAMHELSLAAVSAASPYSSQLSGTMNGPATALREYFTASGLTPLASEWWHFDDNAAMRATSANPSDGKFDITECLSCPPERAARPAL